ncbi:ASCH domain-containing protein [Dermacoccaceae bacterium W4C1]
MDERPQTDPIAEFWQRARSRARSNPAPGYFGVTVRDTLVPPAFSFGSSPSDADALCDLVVAGTKTATASARQEYLEAGDPLPERGDLAIVLDGAGMPRALIRLTRVQVLAFEDVPAEHAYDEGEGDRSLEFWRREHQRFFTRDGRAFDPAMEVVLEEFVRLYP